MPPAVNSTHPDAHTEPMVFTQPHEIGYQRNLFRSGDARAGRHRHLQSSVGCPASTVRLVRRHGAERFRASISGPSAADSLPSRAPRRGHGCKRGGPCGHHCGPMQYRSATSLHRRAIQNEVNKCQKAHYLSTPLPNVKLPPLHRSSSANSRVSSTLPAFTTSNVDFSMTAAVQGYAPGRLSYTQDVCSTSSDRRSCRRSI